MDARRYLAVNGGSRKRGQAVVGVVSDRVRAVDVSIGAVRAALPSGHNALSFRSASEGRADAATFVVPVTR